MMKKAVGVRFKKGGKIYYFDPQDYDLNQSDHVIVETIQGLEYGEVALPPRDIDPKQFKNQLKPVLRKATFQDDREYEAICKREKMTGRIFEEKVEKNGLKMKLVKTEMTFDRKKATFYFTADHRVDFRDLVKDLAAALKMRIELRQIGVRDEVRSFNTLGVCGRDTCCSQWLGDFVPVSIRMAKEQGMSLNTTKISGVCGRLLCCLTYEDEFYKTVTKKMPRIGQKVTTPDGEGTVYRLSVLEEKVVVRSQKESGEVEIKTYALDEIVRQNGVAYEKVFSKDDDKLPKESIADLAESAEESTAVKKKNTSNGTKKARHKKQNAMPIKDEEPFDDVPVKNEKRRKEEEKRQTAKDAKHRGYKNNRHKNKGGRKK